MDYTNITFDDLYSNFLARLSSDPHFKNIGSATVFGMFMEMITASTDMANFNLQRMLEEAFYRTARLDSSYIKLSKNLGYNPRRPVPAQAELCVVLKGPFPKAIKNCKEPITIDLSNNILKLSFLNNPYRLECGYTYTFTQDDMDHCTDQDWSKTLRSASREFKNTKHMPYRYLQKHDSSTNNSLGIRCYQGEEKYVTFYGKEWIDKFDQAGQYYDINDTTFSNWYGTRDPFATHNGELEDPVEWDGKTQVIVTHKPTFAWSESGLMENFKRDIYQIEDASILLNADLIDNNGAYPSPEDAPAICYVETMEDKTVRINFSGLKHLVKPGPQWITDPKTGETVAQNLHIKYLSTVGASANKTGVVDAKLTQSNKIYTYIDGKAYDISNNIEFILKTDILGGYDFESKMDMKDSAEAYFASMMKLVSKRDFIDFFNSLNKPINVTNALVYGIKELDTTYENTIFKGNRKKTEEAETSAKIIQNYIMYTLASNMYAKSGRYQNWSPKNILVKNTKPNGDWDWNFEGFIPEDPADTCTLYCDQYTDHIIDFLKFNVSPEAFYSATQTKAITDDSPQYEKNINDINKTIKRMTAPNTVLYSLPPFMHYFDLVGDVKVSSLTTDLNAYKTKMCNKVYKYLNEHALETREIYKSELIKLFMDEPETAVADLNIKVSSIISPLFRELHWTMTDANKKDGGIRLFLNRDILINHKLKNLSDSITDNQFAFNEIIVPKRDSNYVPITGDSFHGNLITIKSLNFINIDLGQPTVEFTNETLDVQCSITEYDNYIKISLLTPVIGDISDDTCKPLYVDNADNPTDSAAAKIAADIQKYEPGAYNVKMYNCKINSLVMVITTTDNYWTNSKFILTEDRAHDYGFDTVETLNDINNYVNDWIKNDLTIYNQADRAIDLPYNVYSYKICTRLETIRRRGNFVTEPKSTLSEYSFWQYFAPSIIKKYYPKITESTDLNDDEWIHAEALIMDIYRLLKPGITDAILDDNNNIVNYSMDQDIAVVRCLPNISYVNT